MAATQTNDVLLHTVASSIPGLIFAVDGDGTVTLVDGKGLSKAGLKARQMVGSPAEEAFKKYPDIQEGLHRALLGDEHSANSQIGKLTFEIGYSPTRDESGNIKGALAIASEIKDTSKDQAKPTAAEHETQENLLAGVSDQKLGEERLAQALRAANLAYWDYDVINDQFTFNDQFYALLHTTAEAQGGYQMSSRDYAQRFVHPDDAVMVGGEIQQAIESSDPHFTRQIDHRIIYADGQLGWFTVRFSIEKDAAGRTIKTHGANQDITEQKKVEARLAEALRTAHLAYWEYDVLNDLFLFNDQFYALLRTTAEAQGGYQMSSREYAQRFVHPDDAPLVGGEIQKAIESSDPHLTRQIDHRIIYADGKPGWVTVRFSIEKDAEGRTVKTHGANQDITERHKSEDALLSNERELAEAMDRARLADWEFDFVNGEFIFNDRFYGLFHTTAEKVGGYRMTPEQYAQRFVHPDDVGIVNESIERVLASTELHQSIVVDHRILYEDGGLGFISARINVDKDEQGNLLRYYGANQDITEHHQIEEALRANEQQLADAMNIARLANWEFDFVNGEFVFNDQFYALFHTTAEKEGGYRMTAEHYSTRFVHPDDIAAVGASIDRAMASRELHQYIVIDHRVLYADGGIGYISARFNVDKDEQGNLLRYYGANQDITERHQTEEALRTNEAQLAEAMDAARLANWEYDYTRHEFIFDDRFYALFHTTAERVGGYRLTSEQYIGRFVHPDDVRLVSEAIERVMASREQHQSILIDHRILYADGGIGFFSARINVEKDEDGNIRRFYGANQDITERHQTEEALLIGERQLAQAMEIAHLAYWEYSARENRFTLNDQFYALFRTTAEQEAGYHISAQDYTSRFVHPDDRAMVAGEIEKAVKTSERQYTQQLDHRVLFRDGSTGYMTVRIYIEKDENGRILRQYGTHQDITESKRVEMQTQEALHELEHLYQSTTGGGWNSYIAEKERPSAYYYDTLNVEEKTIWVPELAAAVETKSMTQVQDAHETVVAPLSVRGEIIGAIGLMDDKRLSDEDAAMFESVAEQIALALESARLFEQTQQALSQANTFRQLVNATTQGIAMADLQARMVYANDALVRIFGEDSTEKVVGHNLADYYPERIQNFFNQQVLSDVLQKDIWTGELEIASKKGKEVSTINNLFLVKDDAGHPQFIANIVTDITDRKQAEVILRRQNEYLATAGEVSRLITSTLDQPTLFSRAVSLIQSRFKYYHVAVFTVEETGFNAILREATGTAGAEMKSNQHSLQVGSKSIIGYVTGNGETLVVNNTVLDPIHRPNPLLPETLAEAGIPLKIGNRVIGALDIQSRDVNAFHPEDIAVLQTLADQIAVAIDNARSFDIAQKAVDEMREVDRIKSQFLANMSHELRTPLNSIIGFSRVILKGIDGPITDQQNQDLGAIYNSGQHLLGLINDILDLSKIEANKMELSLEEMNIGDTIASVMSTATGLVKDKPALKLKQDIEADLPTIRADPMRIRQILINLISNAAKFTEEGSITVSASPHKGPVGQLEIMVSVTDTGPGISSQDQTKLFQAFSQLDSSPTRKTGGTGLGLAISQQLVDMHGGRIGVHSVVGKGSTFYFTIPQFHQPTAEPVPGQGKIILCVDDDQQVIGLYDRYLKPQGYQVIPVTTPSAARDAIKRLKPYAVTLDIMMPGMDGWSVLQEIKADPETRNVPVIICSIVEEEERGFSLGASDYLVKPILEEDLLGSLNRLNGDGTIKEVLIIDDSADDLRLMEKVIAENTQFRPTLAQGGEKGWEMIINDHPHAIILDLFMPDLNGFTILERLRTTPELRDIPVIVVSGVDLSAEQKKQLENMGKHLLQKGMLNEKELFASLTRALKRLELH